MLVTKSVKVILNLRSRLLNMNGTLKLLWVVFDSLFLFFKLPKKEKLFKKETKRNEMNSDIEDMGLILVESTFRHRKEVERLEKTLLKDRRVKYFNTLNDITGDLQGMFK